MQCSLKVKISGYIISAFSTVMHRNMVTIHFLVSFRVSREFIYFKVSSLDVAVSDVYHH